MTSTASAAEHITGTTRHSSISRRAILRRRGGWNVRLVSPCSTALRSGIGGRPSHDEPFFALRGVADSTPTSPRLGTDRPGAVIPELPRNACLPTRDGATCIQPPESS